MIRPTIGAAALLLSSVLIMGDAATVVVPNLQAAAPKPAPAERMICHRDYEIGSLVKNVRRCATASEWSKSTEAAQRTTESIQADKGRYTDPTAG